MNEEEEDSFTKFNKISEQIWAALHTTDDSRIAWIALTTAIVGYLSEVCPSCRRRMGQELRKDLPMMLAKAERIAVAAPDHDAMCH
jgi:hypothetical protein